MTKKAYEITNKIFGKCLKGKNKYKNLLLHVNEEKNV